MKSVRTAVTQKYQTTIPKSIREVLGVKAGEGVEWHVVKTMVVVHKKGEMKDPVRFLTSQIKMNIDAVRLVREAREEFG